MRHENSGLKNSNLYDMIMLTGLAGCIGIGGKFAYDTFLIVSTPELGYLKLAAIPLAVGTVVFTSIGAYMGRDILKDIYKRRSNI